MGMHYAGQGDLRHVRVAGWFLRSIRLAAG